MSVSWPTDSPLSLLDDDPFANLASSPSHTPTRPKSSAGQSQVRPAHTRPVFTARPSLPSLHTLAQMNMNVPERKVRKGTPGARLPHEPWNMDLSAEPGLLARNTPGAPETQFPKQPPPPPQHIVPTDPLAPAETCFASREFALNSPSLVDETCSSSGDDADTDSLPSLSYTPSEPLSSVLSRASSVASSAHLDGEMDVINSIDHHLDAPSTLHAADDITEEDPLSYHSDFDYYTQSLSDLSDSEPDLTTGESTRHHSSPRDTGVTPYSSVYDPDLEFEPGTSADTMRRASVLRHRTRSNAHSTPSPNPDSPRHADVPRRQPSQSERQGGQEAKGQKVIKRNGDYSGSQFSTTNGGRPGGDDNNGDKPRRVNRRLSFSSTSSGSSSSDDNTDGITVYYSLDGMSNGPSSRGHSRTCSRSKTGGGSDDDIPLAQRVPTALSAQKSIRKQLHDERQQRKLDRAKSSRTAAESCLPSRPAEPVPAPAVPTSGRKRALSAAPLPVSLPRTVPVEMFAAEDLTKKLMNLQSGPRALPPLRPQAYDGSVPAKVPYNIGLSRSSSRGRHTDQTTYHQQKSRVPEVLPQDRPLRSMRSFHRTDGRHSETPRQSTEQMSAPRLGRSTTAVPSSRAVRAGRDTPLAGYVSPGRVSEDGRKPSASVPRSSSDREDVAQRTVQRPPIPPLPAPDTTPPLQMTRVPVVQQRIFIGDMQRFNIVEIGPTTNAGDVVNAVASQGLLDRSGLWMLFEVAQDYGMERPIREYEPLADVSASWNKDKLLNAFVIKQTPLAKLLGRSALPTSSPMHRGWVEWESKRGKWSKRWMELREHGIWLSKRDTGKDEVFLCSLSNFDAYFVTRRHKSPKGFVFAIKSTDHLSLFENAADYLHVFSCNPKDGETWMQVILVARSYVLYQERHVLFAKTGESLSQAKPLARSRTRKQSVSNRPAQPLISVPPPFNQSPTANVAFEPGSLLAKRKGDT